MNFRGTMKVTILTVIPVVAEEGGDMI